MQTSRSRLGMGLQDLVSLIVCDWTAAYVSYRTFQCRSLKFFWRRFWRFRFQKLCARNFTEILINNFLKEKGRTTGLALDFDSRVGPTMVSDAVSSLGKTSLVFIHFSLELKIGGTRKLVAEQPRFKSSGLFDLRNTTIICLPSLHPRCWAPETSPSTLLVLVQWCWEQIGQELIIDRTIELFRKRLSLTVEDT